MAATMRAYQLIGPGLAVVAELPVPEPGPGQVRLKMAASGLCHSDLLVLHADPPFFPVPAVMGHETTGWIDKLGAGVSGLEIGTAVGIYFPWGCGHCLRCGEGAENLCQEAPFVPGFGCGVDGGMAEYVIVDDARHLVPLGDLDPVKAAPLMCAGITTFHAVALARDRLNDDSSTVVIGVGGLGHIAVQILRATTAAQVIAVDVHDEKLAHALSLGAHRAIRAGSSAAEEVRTATGGRGAALVIDLVGNDTTLDFARSILETRGQLQIVGVGGGTLPVRFVEFPRDGSVAIPYAGAIPDLRGVIELAQAGQVEAHVVHIGFDEIGDAYRAMEAGTLQGRAVLVGDHL